MIVTYVFVKWCVTLNRYDWIGCLCIVNSVCDC